MITSYNPIYQEFNIEGVRHITPQNAFAEMQNETAIMVDVRERDEYTLESIPLNNVFFFPLSSIMEHIQNVPDNKPLIVVCEDGVRSTKIVNLFNRYGFHDVANLDGGIVKWKQSGYPVEGVIPLGCGCGCSCSK
ncbi:MAG TPA: rhodanese-like domain-containing protein [Bacteroidales bacterium]|nr:rhodanese-like domain-containing protein [Paludibacteraceae bacterium]HPT14610.1 rhodanese-like domain-containing protein [Bacteroidales bacterium]